MERTVTVTGHGTASATPDSAVLRVAVVHRDTGVAEACAGVDTVLRRLVDEAHRHTAPGDVSTTGLNLWPHHDHEGRQSGFEARHGVAIRVDGVPEAGALVTALAEQVGDALLVEGVTLEVSDPSDAVVAAREAAFADARARAEHLARLGGFDLGALLSVAEGVGGEPRPVGEYAARAVADSGAGLQPGQQEVPASVRVTWAIA